MRVMTAHVIGAVLVLGLVGCKKHESTATVGSEGSVGSAGLTGSGPAEEGGSADSGAVGSSASPDPWAGPGSAGSATTGSAAIGSAATTSAGSAPAAGGKLGSDVMDHETIGGVALGDGPDKVTAALGTPTKKGETVEEAATGDTVQVWEYGSSLVKMSKRDGRWGATAIQVAAPTDWKTSRGIHVGSTQVDVLTVYDGEVQDDGVLVGSTYGGEMFTMKHGKVSEIYLGAMAE